MKSNENSSSINFIQTFCLCLVFLKRQQVFICEQTLQYSLIKNIIIRCSFHFSWIANDKVKAAIHKVVTRTCAKSCVRMQCPCKAAVLNYTPLSKQYNVIAPKILSLLMYNSPSVCKLCLRSRSSFWGNICVGGFLNFVDEGRQKIAE